MEKIAFSTSPILLAAVRNEQNQASNLNIKLICQNSSVIMASGLLMGAISPVLRNIGKTENEFENLDVFLPDHSANQVQSFLKTLVSEQGPNNLEEHAIFTELLNLAKDTGSSNSKDFFIPKSEEDISTLDFSSFPLPSAEVPCQLPDDPLDELLDWGETFDTIETEIPEETAKNTISDITDEDIPLNKIQKFRGHDKSKRKRKRKRNGKKSIDIDDLKGYGKELHDEAKQSYDTTKAIYVCKNCGTERKNTRSMQQHLLWHQRFPSEDFHTSHICKECGKICTDHSLLRAHMRLVHSPRIFRCTETECDKLFKSKEGLKQHLLVHSGVKNFICSECGYAVRTKHHLKLHMLKRHTAMKKTIPCEVCGKLFRHISNLKCHFYTHKARLERHHRCDSCSLTFRTEKSLNSHMALHDPSRPFKCSKCPLRYKNKDALVAHENTHQHNQYKCELCDIAYTRKDNLKRHIKEKHSGLE